MFATGTHDGAVYIWTIPTDARPEIKSRSPKASEEPTDTDSDDDDDDDVGEVPSGALQYGLTRTQRKRVRLAELGDDSVQRIMKLACGYMRADVATRDAFPAGAQLRATVLGSYRDAINKHSSQGRSNGKPSMSNTPNDRESRLVSSPACHRHFG
jgi:hypothetical protein